MSSQTQHTTAFQRMDVLIGRYYVAMGRQYHFDDNGNGIFMKYIMDEDLDDDDLPIIDELGDDCDALQCSYTDFDSSFPVNNNVGVTINHPNRERIIFYVLQFCYKYNRLPTPKEIDGRLMEFEGEFEGELKEYSLSEKFDPKEFELTQTLKDMLTNNRYKLAVYGFIRQLEKSHSFWYSIPHEIIEICFRFYYHYFVPLPDNVTPTPFTLLFAMFQLQPLWSIKQWNVEDIKIECDYLQYDKIDTGEKRKSIANKFIQNVYAISDTHHIADIYQQIIKCLLSRFYHETQISNTSKNIDKWSGRDLILSFIHHLIEEYNVDDSQNKKLTTHPKIWEFIHLLRDYFNQEKYDGKVFLSSFSSNNQKTNNKPAKGYGLQMMKAICFKYQLKSGPFTNVKRSLNKWALKIQQQSHGIGIGTKKQQATTNKYELNVTAQSKFVTDILMYINQQPSSSNNDNLKDKQWYWFDDSDGFKWMKYREVDIQKLNTAWMNDQKSCLIVNEQYTVKFDYSNPNQPSGIQYDNHIQNPEGTVVICSKAKREIHELVHVEKSQR